jgi:hypothetical protein
MGTIFRYLAAIVVCAVLLYFGDSVRVLVYKVFGGETPSTVNIVLLVILSPIWGGVMGGWAASIVSLPAMLTPTPRIVGVVLGAPVLLFLWANTLSLHGGDANWLMILVSYLYSIAATIGTTNVFKKDLNPGNETENTEAN